jgi:hypothetical protein
MTLSIDVKPSTSTVRGISAMKQALEALESWQKTCLDCGRGSEELGRATQPIAALRQAIAETEKQEDWYGQHQWQCGYERGWDAAMEQKEKNT